MKARAVMQENRIIIEKDKLAVQIVSNNIEGSAVIIYRKKSWNDEVDSLFLSKEHLVKVLAALEKAEVKQ